METSIVIPNCNGIDWLPGCLSSIVDQTYGDYEIILVDNNSSDHSLDFISENYPQIKIIKLNSNEGFAAAVNEGIKKATGAFVLLLNTDTVLQPDFLKNISNCLQQADDKVAAVASKMLQMDDPTLVDDVGDQFSWYGMATKGGRGEPFEAHSQSKEIFSPSGGATLYRRSFFQHCGYFDERFFAYLEDVDLGLRGRLMGYRYIYCPTAEVFHKSHGSQLAYRRYISLTTCNRLFIFLKNMPIDLLFKKSGNIIYGQIYFLLAHGKPFASILGYLRCLWYLPSILKSRKQILRGRQITSCDIESLLSQMKPTPNLSTILGAYFKFR